MHIQLLEPGWRRPWTGGIIARVYELYERSYSGSHELTKLECYWMAKGDGTVDRIKGFVDKCMSEYDLDGWTAPDLVNPDDVSALPG